MTSENPSCTEIPVYRPYTPDETVVPNQRSIAVICDDLPEMLAMNSALIRAKFKSVMEVVTFGGVEGVANFVRDNINRILFVLSDYDMLDGTGLDILEELRGSGINVPFVLTSGDYNPSQDSRLNLSYSFMPKPSRPDKLIAAVNEATRLVQKASSIN